MNSETGGGNGTVEGSDGTEPTDPPELPLDALLKLVHNRRRRLILEYLAAHEEPVAIDELVEYLAERVYDCPDSGPTATQRKRMYVGIYQGHLPKMDDMDVVEFDKDRGHIEFGPYGPGATRFVRRLTGNEPPWAYCYLGLSALAVVLFGLVSLRPASSPIADAALGGVIVLLAITAVLHLIHIRGG